MPNIPDQIKLPRHKDRRVKLSPSDKERIRRLYRGGKHSQRSLAGKFQVSRRLIQFILNPDRERIQKERVKLEKRWLKYYDKDKHNQSIASLRAYKRKLYHLPAFKHSTLISAHQRKKINRLKDATK